MIFQQPLVVDTCVLINLLATDCLAQIAQCVAPALLICSAVAAESLYLRPLDPNSEPELVALDPLFAGGLLTACDCANDTEEQLYVDYASKLDDGEAMSLAIAHARNLPLATDEKKAKRIIRDHASHLQVISTTGILKAWAADQSAAEVSRVLRAIGVRARFRPPNDDPLQAWWNSMI